MNMKTLFGAGVMLLALLSYGQDDGTGRGTGVAGSTNVIGGTNYALVVGISDYQFYEDLEYADDDALRLDR